MELRIREVDEGGEGPFDKLRDRGSFSTVEQKVQMEELQWVGLKAFKKWWRLGKSKSPWTAFHGSLVFD